MKIKLPLPIISTSKAVKKALLQDIIVLTFYDKYLDLDYMRIAIRGIDIVWYGGWIIFLSLSFSGVI